jgi:hypothetical protein
VLAQRELGLQVRGLVPLGCLLGLAARGRGHRGGAAAGADLLAGPVGFQKLAMGTELGV